ncbi:hypothetical protein GCM10020358_34350 [Amorphoplanes nipponensis]
MMLTDPAPLAIWMTLLLLAALSVAALAGVDGVRDPHLVLIDAVPFLRRWRAERARRGQDAAHAVRYAEELTVAAERAARVADRWREHSRHSEQNAATAWQEWQDAAQRLTVVRAASAFPMPAARTPAEYADRERFLHRTIVAAAGRGDLPATAPAEALAGHGGWNPWLHPVEQEFAVQRATVAHRRRLHQRAVMAEKAARHDAQLARTTRDSLRREAAVAVARAAAVRHLTPRVRPRRVRFVAPVSFAALRGLGV